jgi:hypothetical protein
MTGMVCPLLRRTPLTANGPPVHPMSDTPAFRLYPRRHAHDATASKSAPSRPADSGPRRSRQTLSYSRRRTAAPH